ncbi:hypothetical protein ACFQ51_26915 [Streptomyces kaempferi]
MGETFSGRAVDPWGSAGKDDSTREYLSFNQKSGRVIRFTRSGDPAERHGGEREKGAAAPFTREFGQTCAACGVGRCDVVPT